MIRSSKKLYHILEVCRQKRKTVGFVPTMGALHEGHLSLVRASRRENRVTVVSVFVNPTQFGPKEDFSRYPRVLSHDKRLLSECGADYLFYPSVQEMYPEGLLKPLKIPGAKWPVLAKGLCGKFRPGHFQGVVTVVAKFLEMIKPTRLYLGAKDYQQARVLTRMVEDLSLKVKVRVMPTVREKDGLAMSSRNRFLTPEERARATMISRVLFDLRKGLKKRQKTIRELKKQALRELERYVDKVQYLEVMDADWLVPARAYGGDLAALTACFVGKTRLIDNVIIHAS